MKAELIIFDLDGTLVDSFPGIRLGLNLALAELGLAEIDLEWVRRHVGRGADRLVAAAAAAAAGGRVEVSVMAERFRFHYGRIVVAHSPPYPGVDRSLRFLARKHRLAVASNKPIEWTGKLVESLGWRELMGAVVGPETVGAHKPDPAMIEAVLRMTGCDAASSLLVGDMPVDAETGRAAGIPVVGLTTGSASVEELRAAGCTIVLESMPDLVKWLE